MINYASLWPEAFFTDDITTKNIIKKLDKICKRYGSQDEIMSDNKSKFFLENFKLQGIKGNKKRLTPVYNLNINDLIERLNISLKYKVEEAVQNGTTIKENINDFLEWYRSANHS